MRNPGAVFAGIKIGDQVTVSNDRSPHDGRSGPVVGASAGRVSVQMLINNEVRVIRFFPYELVKG